MSAARTHPASGLYRLRVELVPSTCWLSNVRSLMRERAWKRLAAEVAEDGRGRCEVCSGRGRQHAVECHEVWHYNDGRGVQLLMRLQALCPRCHRVKHLGRTSSLGYGEQACAWLAHVNEWDHATTERYVDAVFMQWSARSQRAWTLDLTVLGEAYQVGLDDLGLDSYVLAPREREQMQHRRAVLMEDVYQRDSGMARLGPADAAHNPPRKRYKDVPRQTRDTALPKPPPAPIDWVKIAQSGRVWEFIEGEDFTGQAASFRARAKTAARKLGVDFESVETSRGGKAVLKILAFMMETERRPKAGASAQSTPAANETTGVLEVEELAGQLALGGLSSQDELGGEAAAPARQSRRSML